ncbi:MAG: DUF411 domain-containing protein [Magnetovibrio sp.]|nr:DUF411 domain-containing protein [Magnetovibrio sp.]
MRKIFKIGVVTLGLVGAGFVAWTMNSSTSAKAAEMVVYKSPSCGCCGAWIDHVKDSGFEVEVHDVLDLSAIKAKAGVPGEMESCHTAMIDGYVVEGHVPADDIKQLLVERPDVNGISVPGMPIGSPGMEMGDEKEPYASVLFSEAGYQVFAEHN